jgi:MFS family permease
MSRPPDDPAEAGRHDPYAALRHRDFRLILAGTILASVGNEMQAVAVGWELYERTGSAMDLGLVGLVQALPVMLLALPAGHLADRASRKGIALATQTALAVASLGLAMVSATRAPVPWVYACLALAGVANAFAFPARWALLPQLVPLEDFNNAVTWRSSGWQIAAVAGPALGGLVIALGRGATPVYVLDATLGLIVVALVSGLRGRPQEKAEGELSWESLLAGVRFVWRTELILATITLDMFAVLLGGATTLLPIYARDILHVGPTGLGCLRAAPSIGAVMMAVTLAHRPPLRRAGRALLLAVGGFGVATIVFGLSRDFRLSLAMLLLSGALDNVSVVVRATLVQLLTPDAMRGRVASVNSVFIGMSNELGGFESGVAARLLGPVGAVVVGGVGALLVVLGVVVTWPGVWRLGSLADVAREYGEATSGAAGATPPLSVEA